MLQKWGQSALLNSAITSDYSPNTSKASTKLVCNQQEALRTTYQKGRWQTFSSTEREPKLALCHRHSQMTCTQQNGLSDPAVPQAVLVTNILQEILCLCQSSHHLTKRKKNLSVRKCFKTHKINWKNMLKNCHPILPPFLYFSLGITIRSVLGTGYFARRNFDAAHYGFSPTSSLMVFTWYNRDYCKHSFSFIQNYLCCKTMHSSPCL